MQVGQLQQRRGIARRQRQHALEAGDRLVEAAKPWGLKGWEFSWVLESNHNSRGTLKRAGTKLTKTYRIYDRAL